PLETILALAEPGLESLDTAQPLPEPPLPEAETRVQPSANRLDPYADQYSLTDFVAEALSVFGGLPEFGHTGQAPPHSRTVAPRPDVAPPSRLNPEATMPSRRATPPRSFDSRRPA
ncbi:MAG: hypothetical protein ACRD1B_01275, partial [Thermoanaerobaculia bacterium]